MKTKLLVSLALVATLATGYFLGRWHIKRTVDSYVAKVSAPEVRRATVDFSKAAGLLKALRNGNTNEAIETLEDELDTQIMFIGAIAEATPVSERDPQWLSRIRWLRNYRAEHPRKSEHSFIDDEVAHVLSLVETNR